MAKSEALIVEIEEEGVLHFEGDTLVLGDLDVMKAVKQAWGGNRQRVRLVVQVYIQTRTSANVSPDGNGALSEGSEPKAAVVAVG